MTADSGSRSCTTASSAAARRCGGAAGARRRPLPAGVAALLASALYLAAPAATAQPGNKAAAESLFQAGKQLMNDGKVDEACPKFAESSRLDPSVGTSLNLGKCYEAQGKLASAWAEYKEAAVLARRLGEADREAAAKDFAAKIEPRLSKLRIDAAPGVAELPGLEIRQDGAPIGTGSLGLAIATDPGEHTLEAVAPGYAPWSTKITLGNEADTKTAAIPMLAKAPEGSSAVTPGSDPQASPVSVAAPAAGDTAGDGSTMRTASYVLGGVGVVGVGLGAVFGLLAAGEVSDAEDDPALCPNKLCTDAGRSQIDSAETKATVSTVGFVVGGAALAAGVVLFVMAPSRKEQAKAPQGAYARVLPGFDARGGSLSVVGGF